MSALPLREALTALLAAFLVTTTAQANGRLPGATGLAINPADDQQLLLGLTFGLALTRDSGASWTWVCEEQIEGNGGDVDPAIVMTDDGTLIVLSLTNGGVLVSRDDACSFERAQGSLQGQRGVDLTLDASAPNHVLVLMSTIVEVLDTGFPRFHTMVAHSFDRGRSWETLAELPEDLAGETIEVAPSDPKRIYVSGTLNSDPLQGIVERSDDGGLTWTRSTTALPRGSGSLYLSGIHPQDPDRLWFRVPGRGDIYGVLPARLWLSTDGAASFDQIAATQAGMLGFALSPDGEQVAYGGPMDGLFGASADSSGTPTKVSDLRVNCLRWVASGLYVCGHEPQDPYSLGHATDPTQGFTPMWQRADTCRAACAPPSPLETKCKQPWETIAPLVMAEKALCDGSSPEEGSADAGARDVDASQAVDASARGKSTKPKAKAASGCTVGNVSGLDRPWWVALWVALAIRLGARSSRRRRTTTT